MKEKNDLGKLEELYKKKKGCEWTLPASFENFYMTAWNRIAYKGCIDRIRRGFFPLIMITILNKLL